MRDLCSQLALVLIAVAMAVTIEARLDFPDLLMRLFFDRYDQVLIVALGLALAWPRDTSPRTSIDPADKGPAPDSYFIAPFQRGGNP